MSLAEDLRRSLDRTPERGGTDRGLRRPLVEMLPKVAAAPAIHLATADVRKEKPQAKSADASLDVLDRASKGVVYILDRYKQLEEHVKQLDAWSKAQIQAAEASAQRWQQVATASEQKLQELQKTVETVSLRAETAEQSLKRDKEALAFLQDRIIAAFGFGSEAHDAIKAMGIE